MVSISSPPGKMVTFTDLAASKVREYLQHSGKSDATLRFSVVRTHCMGGRGHGYVLKEGSPSDGDLVVEDKGIRVAIDPSSSQHVGGTEIDYRVSLQESGFVISNPNAVAKCPCGHHDIFS